MGHQTFDTNRFKKKTFDTNNFIFRFLLVVEEGILSVAAFDIYWRYDRLISKSVGSCGSTNKLGI